jgi:peptidoglycan/xylan/chitin deacetylase (PgdA/CDA1 family)
MRDLLILCHHAVSPTWEEEISVTPDALRSQLELLVERGYRGATFTDAVLAPRGSKVVAVTFDDGFSSVARLAKPVLDELGLPGTLFAVTDFARDGGRLVWDGIDHWVGTPDEDELEGMRWPELAALADAGWEIGSHTCSHPRLTRLDDAALEREMVASRTACEEALGRPCRSIAYPYGDMDARVVAAARAAGYEAAAALPASLPRRSGPLDAPRIGVWHTDDLRRFKVKVSPLVRRVRATLGR